MRVLMFPGLGAAYARMLEKYLTAYPEDSVPARAWLDAVATDGHSAEYAAELHAQAEIHALNLLWWRRARTSLAADAVCGHSLGYYAALVAAGVVDEDTSFALLAAVLRTLWPAFVDHAQQVRVLTVRHETDMDTLAARHGMELIAWNNARQAVLYGSDAAWRALTRDLGDDVLSGVSLPTRIPFHSETIRSFAKLLHDEVHAVIDRPGACRLQLWSHIDAAPVEDGAHAMALVAAQPYRAVRWARLLEVLRGRGAVEFTEIGPNRTLTQIARLSAPQVEARFIDHLRRQGVDREQFH